MVLPTSMLRAVHSHLARGDCSGLGAAFFCVMVCIPFLGGGDATYAAAMMSGLITKSDFSTVDLSAFDLLYFKPMITLPAFRLIRSD